MRVTPAMNRLVWGRRRHAGHQQQRKHDVDVETVRALQAEHWDDEDREHEKTEQEREASLRGQHLGNDAVDPFIHVCLVR